MPLSKKRCPLLEKRGVFDKETGYGGGKSEEKNWIKDLCLNCPLGEKGRCVYEKPGRISKEDRKLLEEV